MIRIEFRRAGGSAAIVSPRVAQLGNIYEDSVRSGATRRGPDLRVQVTLPRGRLGQPDGILVPVPATVAYRGSTVPRSRGPGDPPEGVKVHLPADFASGATLRIRGQGGEHPKSGVAGDLLLSVVVEESSGAGGKVFGALVAIAALTGAYFVWAG